MNDLLIKYTKETLTASRALIKYILLILFCIYMLSGIYSVKSNETAVLKMFGGVVASDIKPGIHYALPRPFYSIDKAPVREMKRIFIEDFYLTNDTESVSSKFYDYTGLNPYCVTGDNNIVNLSCAVQYMISDPVNFLYKNADVTETLKTIAANSIIHCISEISIDEALTFGKKKIENILQLNIQKKLDELDAGLTINFVELRELRPPENVQSYFDDVINAKIDMQNYINNAESARNEKIPKANADANKIIQNAHSYKLDVISAAEGEASRFNDVLKNYRASADMNKKRMYIDFINDIFPKLERKYILAPANNKNPVELKIFDNQ